MRIKQRDDELIIRRQAVPELRKGCQVQTMPEMQILGIKEQGMLPHDMPMFLRILLRLRE